MHIERLGFSPEETRRALGISKSLIYRLINQGEIKTIRLGHRHIIPRSEIERIIKVNYTNW